MAETAAWIVDGEGFMGSCARAMGQDFHPDVIRILEAIQAMRPDRSTLWLKWIAPAQFSAGGVQSIGANPFFRCLQRRGYRLELVEGKPISRATGRLEANACDFAVIKAIRLAQKKVDTIVLVANDGHFAHVLDEAHNECGCRVEVVCDRRGLSSLVTADQFHFLDDLLLRQDFAYRQQSRFAARQSTPNFPESSHASEFQDHGAA